MNDGKLSKLLSYILRHSPQEYNLSLDVGGWVDAYDLIDEIKVAHLEYSNLVYDDLLRIANHAAKKRHEMLDGRIRAIYGHSVEVDTIYEEGAPPEYLYHGTPRKNIFFIQSEGLKSMQRHYVHLTDDMNEARSVGARKGGETAVLKIASGIASGDGVKFLRAGSLWLCECVSNQYIIFPES